MILEKIFHVKSSIRNYSSKFHRIIFSRLIGFPGALATFHVYSKRVEFIQDFRYNHHHYVTWYQKDLLSIIA
jgi:hypothetical protein